MKSTRSLFFSALALAAVGISTAQAQVKADLVAADQSAQPGKSLTVALKLEHQPHWHTYWVNPGIGTPTSIEWTLPQGWTAGDIEWPTPIAIRGEDGALTGHGYEGVTYLPVTIKVPQTAKAGESVTLKAAASWLMCSDMCIPGNADLEIKVPVKAEAPAPNADVRAGLAKMSMPQAGKNLKVAASRSKKDATLTITGAPELKNAHFFSESELIDYEGAQKFDAAGGKLKVTLPIDETYEEKVTKLSGLLAYTDASGAYTSIRVEAPFSK